MTDDGAKLRTVRGADGWALYCIEDGAPEEGMAVIEQRGGDLLTGTWFLGVYPELQVKLWANATLTEGFCEMLSEALGLRVYC